MLVMTNYVKMTYVYGINSSGKSVACAKGKFSKPYLLIFSKLLLSLTCFVVCKFSNSIYN